MWHYVTYLEMTQNATCNSNMLFAACINPLLLSIQSAASTQLKLVQYFWNVPSHFYHSVTFRLTLRPIRMQKCHGMGSVIQFSGVQLVPNHGSWMSAEL